MIKAFLYLDLNPEPKSQPSIVYNQCF